MEMSTINKIRNIQMRILNSAAMAVEYNSSWGDEYSLEEIKRSLSSESSFSFSENAVISIGELQQCSAEELYNTGFANWDSMTEAKNAVIPFLTLENAKLYDQKDDKMLWIEENIFGPAGVDASVCTNFGETLCAFCEFKFDKYIEEYS